MVESLRRQILTDPHSLPKIELHSSDFYLGEYPWRRETRNFDQWSTDNGWRSLAAPCRPTVASYTRANVAITTTQSIALSALRFLRRGSPMQWDFGWRMGNHRSISAQTAERCF